MAKQEKRQCCRCSQWRALKYYKQSNKTGDWCVNCNFCRLKQNSYLRKHNRSPRGKERRRRSKEERDANRPKGHLNVPHNVQNRKSEHVLLCRSCKRKIGHIVYRGCSEQ